MSRSSPAPGLWPSGGVVEQGQLAEEVAGAEDGQHDFMPFGGCVADLDLAADDQIEQAAGVAQVKDDLTQGEPPRHEALAQLLGVVFGHVGEKRHDL